MVSQNLESGIKSWSENNITDSIISRAIERIQGTASELFEEIKEFNLSEFIDKIINYFKGLFGFNESDEEDILNSFMQGADSEEAKVSLVESFLLGKSIESSGGFSSASKPEVKIENMSIEEFEAWMEGRLNSDNNAGSEIEIGETASMEPGISGERKGRTKSKGGVYANFPQRYQSDYFDFALKAIEKIENRSAGASAYDTPSKIGFCVGEIGSTQIHPHNWLNWSEDVGLDVVGAVEGSVGSIVNNPNASWLGRYKGFGLSKSDLRTDITEEDARFVREMKSHSWIPSKNCSNPERKKYYKLSRILWALSQSGNKAVSYEAEIAIRNKKISQYFEKYKDWGAVMCEWNSGRGESMTGNKPCSSDWGGRYVYDGLKEMKKQLEASGESTDFPEESDAVDGIISKGSLFDLAFRRNLSRRLVKRSNNLDVRGYFHESDRLDNILIQLSN